jgi:hypothetical protein
MGIASSITHCGTVNDTLKYIFISIVFASNQAFHVIYLPMDHPAATITARRVGK